MVCQVPADEVEEPFLQPFRQVADFLSGFGLTFRRLLVGEITFACDRATPDKGVAQDGSLEEGLIVEEDLFGCFTEENLILGLETSWRLRLDKWLLSEQRHPPAGTVACPALLNAPFPRKFLMGNLKQSVDILHWLVVDTFIGSEGLIKKYYNQ